MQSLPSVTPTKFGSASSLRLTTSCVYPIIDEFGLTASDLFGRKAGGAGKRGRPAKKAATKKRVAKKRGKVAPKYKNPATGETWTGRGKAPKWIAGKDRSKFAIK